MKELIRKILKEETEEVFEIPGLEYFPDGVESLREFLKFKNIKRWSLDDDLDLRDYKGDLSFLDGLVSIKGDLDLSWTPIESLGNLQSVGGFLDLRGTPIESLENLEYVGRYLDLRGTPIEYLGDLKHVGSHLDLYGTPIKSIGNLEYVGGSLDLERTSIKSLGNLEYVGGNLYLNENLSRKYKEDELRTMLNIEGSIRL